MLKILCIATSPWPRANRIPMTKPRCQQWQHCSACRRRGHQSDTDCSRRGYRRVRDDGCRRGGSCDACCSTVSCGVESGGSDWTCRSGRQCLSGLDLGCNTRRHQLHRVAGTQGERPGHDSGHRHVACLHRCRGNERHDLLLPGLGPQRLQQQRQLRRGQRDAGPPYPATSPPQPATIKSASRGPQVRAPPLTAFSARW